MKEMICGLLLVVVLSSFVVAGSEITANFVVRGTETEVVNYVSAGSFWSDYVGYIIVVLIIFVIGYFVLKTNVKKVSKGKKIFKGKVRKRK